MDDKIIVDLSAMDETPKTKKNTQARDWCFTVNNPVQDEQQFMEYLQTVKDLRYVVFQRERAPETGTEHYQGYFEFTQPKWFGGINGVYQKKLSALTRILNSAKENAHKRVNTVWTRKRA